MTSTDSHENKEEPLIQAASTSETMIFQPPHLRTLVVASQSSGSSEVTPTSSVAECDDFLDEKNKKNKGGGFKLPGSIKSFWGGVEGGNKNDIDRNFVLVDPSNFSHGKSRITKARGIIDRLPNWTKAFSGTVVAGLLFFMVYVSLADTPFMQSIAHVKDTIFGSWDKEYNVAFIGNSYLYVNDIPRVMESISRGKIHQNSCIHPAGSLGKIYRSGNGMYGRWNSNNSVERTNLNNFYDYIDEDYVLYDYGACSVYQLIDGYDNDLVSQNYNGAYYDDGTNPCFQDPYYLGLLSELELVSNNYMMWDFIVLNDQTKRMAFENSREETIQALKYAYAPLIREARAIPILVDTHAFWSESGNMTGIEDIPHFTAEIYEGLREYMFALKYNLPNNLAPKVAPVGLAYLTIYEEDEEMWKKLFLSDLVHASPTGSYLFACVLYCTIYGHLPRNGEVAAIFETARGVQDSVGYPTKREAHYLRAIARRVTIGKYVPSILSEYGDTSFLLEGLDAGEDGYQTYWNGYENNMDWDESEAASDKSQEEYQWTAEENAYAQGQN